MLKFTDTLYLVTLLVKLSYSSPLPSAASFLTLLDNHVRLHKGNCEVILKVPYDEPNGNYSVKTIENVSDNGICRQQAVDLMNSAGTQPFLDYQHTIDAANEIYPSLKVKFETAIEECSRWGKFNVVKVDSRVKQFDSLKNKMFDRIKASKDPTTIPDVEDSDAGHDSFKGSMTGTKKLALCLRNKYENELNIQTGSLRTRDGLVFYLSGDLPFEALDPTTGNTIYEIQTWPKYTGLFMIWRHDLYYKNSDATMKELGKNYKKSIEMAAQCLDHSENQEVIKTLKSKQDVRNWLDEKCPAFLKSQHEATSKKPYQPETDDFNLDPVEGFPVFDIAAMVNEDLE